MQNNLKFSKPQRKVLLSRQALTLNMAGQRSGKSHIIGFMSGHYITNFPRVKGFIGANSYMQLSQSTLVRVTAVWREVFGYFEYDAKRNPGGHFVVDKVPPAHFEQFETYKDYRNIISFINGGIIYVGSLDNYKAHDGKEFGWAHLDETKDTKKEALTTVILGRLSQPGLYYDTNGQLVYTEDPQEDYTAFNPAYIHTSPALGQVDWLMEMFELNGEEDIIKAKIIPEGSYYYREKNGRAVCIYATHHNRHNLPKNYIANRLNSLTEGEALKFIYGYPFSKTGGEFYTQFERLRHCRGLEYYADQPIHVTFDFNVMPYMTMVCIQALLVSRGYDDQTGKYYEPEERPALPVVDVWQVRFFKEFCLPSPLNSTRAVCESFAATFQVYDPDVFYYGDASGKNRVPGYGDGTNFKEVKATIPQFLNNASDRVPRANPSVLKRRAFIERILAGKYPIELLIDPVECPETVKDFEFVKLGPTGKVKERIKDANGITYEKNGHATDAAEYFLTEFFREMYKKSL